MMRKLITGTGIFLSENKGNVLVWIIFLFCCSRNSYSSFGEFFVRQFLLMAFMTIGVSLEMLCGDFDLSFAAQMAASAMAAAYMIKQGGSLWLACFIIIMFHALAGVLKGFLMAKVRIPSIIMTLALQTIFRNIFAGLGNGNNILFKIEKNYYNDRQFWIVIFVLFIVMLLLAILFLNHTYYGKYCRMIGEDMELARQSGLRCEAILIIIHMTASLFFAVPSIIMMVQTMSGSINMGSNYLYKVLAAACIGGIGFQNGKGKISGMLAGTVSMILIIFLLTDGGYLNRWESIIEGGIILFFVCAAAGGTAKRVKN